MNRTVLPTKQSATACIYFSNWLKSQMDENNVNAVQLAHAVGLERKTIMRYYAGRQYPKLDVLAKIYTYFGKRTIIIPLDVPVKVGDEE